MRVTTVIAAAAAVAVASFSSHVEAGGSTNAVPAGKIKNVVLLVLENRSFDNLLGYWARTRSNVDGVPANACNILKSTGAKICSTDQQIYVNLDPNHETIDVTGEIYGKGTDTLTAAANAVPNMSGFVDIMETTWNTTDPQILRQVMDGYNPRNIPVTAALASEFAVFDRWFSSMPGPTYPNRLFLYSATAAGQIKNDDLRTLKGFSQKSIFGALDDAKVTWKNYFGIVPTSIMLNDARDIPDIFTKLKPMNEFYEDAKKGTLPSFSFIDPILFEIAGLKANDNHPPHNVARGEKLVKDIYESLRKSPQWNTTLFLITYDENGGFWDHVSPPAKNVPIPDDISAANPTFKFDRLGARVPTIAISPWIQKGRVVSRPPNGPTPSSEFEHSSVSATLKKIFNLPNFLTKRDAWAGSFEFLFDEVKTVRTDCPVVLPEAPAVDASFASVESEDDDSQEEYASFVQVFKAL
ncbi:hypothetical protein HDU97_008413 [Phlyctochytrium planicorne]|nr:hypothetical protein HDU97_008413 [Phlyctochytrium planicorne]